jgi:uncharacterized lipoprotein YajG
MSPDRRATTQEVLVAVQGGARRRAAVGAVLALATTAVLTACTGHPGTAAVVDGTTITTSQLNSAYTEISPYLKDVSTAHVLGLLVAEPTVTAMAAEQGVAASDEAADALLAEVSKADPGATFSDSSVAIARYSVAYTNLQTLPDANTVLQETADRVAKLDVTVNPRFASLDKDNQIGEPTPPAWVVDKNAPRPADSPAPSPSATS